MRLLFIISLFIGQFVFAQDFDNGDYILTNENGIVVSIKVCESGETICSFIFTNAQNEIESAGEGYWFRVNTHGVSDEYDGPEGWYQIETSEGINYELEWAGENKYILSNDSESYELFTRK